MEPIFLRGLVHEIKERLKYREHNSLDDVVKSAMYVESQLSRNDNTYAM